MNYEESVRALLALGRELAAPQQARVQKFGLENIRIVSAELGNPHHAVPCVHIAGTNGKGSTAAMLESILRSSGLKTGLYTSPHLERINERIRINGEELPDADFAAAWTRVQAAIESLMASGKLGVHPTFFECVTAMAFVAFQERRIGFAVYEVGLGGRLDSTNIVEPEVAVLTPIDFDHENFLGHSIEEIAGEKAGIIKAGAWVASSDQRGEAAKVITARAVEMKARLVESSTAWNTGKVAPSGDGFYRAVIAPVSGGPEVELAPGLPGRFQIQNATTAATAARLLAERGFPVTDASISAGIAAARWPGRLERLSERPAIYLDGAHNPAAARELRRFCDENFKGRRIVLVYGAMRDKAVDEIAGQLFPIADRVILTQAHQSRAISATLLAEMTADLTRDSVVVSDPREALERALAKASPEDVVIVTGSLYLVGDLRGYWRARRPVRT
ncbi:MAG TPA: folylpolyglutamate synthase/dihydrofolate synthase family protein [Candidatus Limnocylindrales bacterium]|nr:folylpolyglutamate synthase/dihydrofolate synthase family protein [Candidatus Limnocylindrales bacterium]